MKSKENNMFVEVALSLPLTMHLHYTIPDHLKTSVEVGKRVLVPLGKRKVTGYVIGRVQESEVSEVKEIIEVLDDQPLFTSQHLSFYRWVSDYYFFPLGGVIRTALPSNLTVESTQAISLTDEGVRALTGGEHVPAMSLLRKIGSKKQISLKTLLRSSEREGIYVLLTQLEKKGLIRRQYSQAAPLVKMKKETWITIAAESSRVLDCPDELDALFRKAPKQLLFFHFLAERGSVSLQEARQEFGECSRLLRNLEEKGLVRSECREVYRDPLVGEEVMLETVPQLSKEQREVMEKIRKAFEAQKYAPFLLYGVTGSGKTEVYLKSVEEVLKRGKEALVLVPEISLTPQLVSRFKARFRDEMVLFHSRLSPGERYDGWRRIQRGIVKIAIGARSAIFSPFSRLGLIIVDEEHATSYKQEEKLRYHARDLALVRGKMDSTVVILGSATPSLESYYNSQSGKLTLLKLTERVEGKPLPVVEIVDMREKKSEKAGARAELSCRLKDALVERLNLKQHSLLFLNRRGFAPFIICWECGHTFGCPNCSVSLIHHQREKNLQCHYCGYAVPVPEICPQCGGVRIQLLGWGTERLEDEVRALYPSAQVERMDQDTTGGKWGHRKVLKRFSDSDRGVLIGTQMIAKGHDMPQVTLVGVLSADLSLHFPDFRSSERTFQLLTQVAGRAGRGDVPGEVIIQTFHPQHYSIKASQQHAFSDFYEEELTFRRELNYPPFSRLINFKIEGNSESKTSAFAESMGKLAHDLSSKTSRYQRDIEILGPASSPWKKIKGKYRYQMLLKGSRLTTLRSFTSHLLTQIPHKLRGSGVNCAVDIDPVSLL